MIARENIRGHMSIVMKNASTSGYDKSRLSCLLTRICTTLEALGRTVWFGRRAAEPDESVPELQFHERKSAAHANHLPKFAAGSVCFPAVSRRTAGRTTKASLVNPGQTWRKRARIRELQGLRVRFNLGFAWFEQSWHKM